MKNFQTIVLCLLLLCLSCNKDDSPSNNDQNQGTDPTAFAENFGSEIQRNFLGNVIDTNRNPIQGVTITIGSKTALTDANGIFIINDATVHQRFGYVKAEKAGYLHGSRSVVPSSGTNKVTIMLLQENIVSTTNSGTSETIVLPNGASVALQGNYKKVDGSAYSGSVNVIMHHLDPADEDMKDQMPGMLYAANTQNEERMLQTFGMLAVELKGSGGETLNLADGSSAEIKVPLDPSLMATAPSTIPLWHFDETYGYWIEDGQATLVGNAYVGRVTHFSFWNCGIPAETVNLCVTVQDSNGNPLAYTYVIIHSNTFGTIGAFTNVNGEVCGLVPSNEILNVTVSDVNLCNIENLYNGNIGPFVQDSSITITLTDSNTYITQTVLGNFTTCDGNLVTDGYVVLLYNGVEHFASMHDGSFEFNFMSCSTNNTFYLYGADYVNTQETDPIAFTFTPPITNVGTLAACNSIEEFITYQVDDHPVITYNFDINANFVVWTIDYIDINYFSNNPNIFFEMNLVTYESPGIYIDPFINFSDQNQDHTILLGGYHFRGVVNVTAFGEVGEYIDINFIGNLVDTDETNGTTIPTVPITGTMHVLRDQ